MAEQQTQAWAGELFERRGVGLVQCASEAFVFGGETQADPATDEPACGPDGRFEQGVRLRLQGERADVGSMSIAQWRDLVLDSVGDRVGSGLVSLEVQSTPGSLSGSYLAVATVAGRCDLLSECCGHSDLEEVEPAQATTRWAKHGKGPAAATQLEGVEGFCGECGGSIEEVIYAAAVSPVSDHFPELTEEQERIAAGSLRDPFEDLYVTTMVVPHPEEMAQAAASAIDTHRMTLRAEGARRITDAIEGTAGSRPAGLRLSRDEAAGVLEGVLWEAEIDSTVVRDSTAWWNWEDEITTLRRGDVVAAVYAGDDVEPDTDGWSFEVAFGFWGSHDGRRRLEEPLDDPAVFRVGHDGSVGCGDQPTRWASDEWRAAAEATDLLPHAVDLCVD